ncbi:unnamed protein product [marine sediment metagenome]|uniref:Uncharacterized protein n=1 Tax=marine sediment metagenome TaxID=412755 RepID=X1PI31_9ZZZZ
MSEQVHTIHIRKLKHEAYERFWNLRRYYNASSWADLIDKITKEYVKQIEEFDWI